MFSSFDLLLGELIYLVSILSYHRNLMSLFFKKNFLCAVFKVHLPLPYCHTCLVPIKAIKLFKEPGSHLLSHAVSSIVPSAAQVLTIVFGMGTGVSPERIATGNILSSFCLITE